MFSIGKQPYKDVINFVSYIHVVYSYNDINFTYLYMRTNYLCHLANIVHILWSRPVGDGLFLPPPPPCGRPCLQSRGLIMTISCIKK